MKPLNKITVAIIAIILICIAVSYYNVIKHYRLQQVTYDLPEEFNPNTVSKDRSDATPMMVVYDTLSNTYIFEFMDK
jgi:Tfp pilus assembly protein PilE